MLRVSRPGEVAVVYAAYKVLYALAVWPVALILAVIGAWWPLALVLACGLCEWLGVPERVGAWLGGDRR